MQKRSFRNLYSILETKEKEKGNEKVKEKLEKKPSDSIKKTEDLKF